MLILNIIILFFIPFLAIANPTTISTTSYNQARSILANAGSQTATKTHPARGNVHLPVSYGISLLVNARDEFRSTDRNIPPKQKKSDMSILHFNALNSAENIMGIDY
jgi:hypothetical protein